MTTQPDPWKGLRGVFAGTALMEAIVVGLATAVVAKLGDDDVGAAGAIYVAAVAVLLLLVAFVQRRPWGLGAALALQPAVIVGAFAHVAVGAMGVIFALVWLYLLFLRREMQRRFDAGTLPGQQQPSGG